MAWRKFGRKSSLGNCAGGDGNELFFEPGLLRTICALFWFLHLQSDQETGLYHNTQLLLYPRTTEQLMMWQKKGTLGRKFGERFESFLPSSHTYFPVPLRESNAHALMGI